MKLISVIIPVYKVEQYLKRCVDSVLNQTYKNIEIILVDDGSPDNCPQLCDKFASENSLIKVVHKKNGGASSARNAGLDVCNGDYISFIDSDDFIDENFLSRLYSLIRKYEADVAMVKYREVSSNEKLPKIIECKELFFSGHEIEKAFLDLKIDSVCVGLYSKKAIKDIRFIVGKTSEDISFNFEIFRTITTFVFSPEKRYYYFYNAEYVSNGELNSNMFNYLNFRKDIYDYYQSKNNVLYREAAALYARAAFGLQTRMALYGIKKDLNERDCKKLFTKIFMEHKKYFFISKNIPFLKKIAAVLVFYFYGIVKTIGRFKK